MSDIKNLKQAIQETLKEESSKPSNNGFVDFKTVVEKTAAKISNKGANLSKLMQVSKKYVLPKTSGKLVVEAKDREMFEALYPETGGDAGVGKGEIALWWLFGGMVGWAKKGDAHAVDLEIRGVPVEVKSIPGHNQLIPIGKITEDKENERLLSILFGVDNLAWAFRADRKKMSMKTDKGFSAEDIRDAAEVMYDFNVVLASEGAKLAKKYQIFADIANSVKQFFTILGTTSDKIEDITVSILKSIITKKLEKKPGDGGYIINLKAGQPLDIAVFKIDFDRIPDNFAAFNKRINVHSMTLYIHLGALFGGEK